MRIKVNIKQKQIVVFRTVIAVSIASAFIYYLIILMGNLGSTKNVAGATVKNTIANGEWSSSIWSNSSGGPSCGCTPGCNYSGNGIVIKHSVTSSTCSPLEYSGGGTMLITGNGKLIVNSGLTISNGSALNISANDSVIVNGNFIVTGGSSANIDGYLRVNGNVTLSGSSTVCGNGLATYSGTLTGSGWCNTTLPINLLNFEAKLNNDKVSLNWTTASEIDNDYFTVERSTDGKSFSEIQKKQGAGNSTTILHYSAIDENPLKGINYYRLKQTDYNGRFTFGKIVHIINGKSNDNETIVLETISPNPFTDNLNVFYSVSEPGEVLIKLMDYTGRIIYKETTQAEKGFNTLKLDDVEKWKSGNYFINMTFNGKVVTKKVMKISN